MIKHIMPLLCVAVAGAVSCTKNYSNSPGPYSNLQSALADQAKKIKTVTFDAATGCSFYDTSGSRYEIPPNAFSTGNGAYVTGNVTVKAVSYLKKSDMLFSKVLTVSNGEPIVSGGEFNMSANQDGAALKVGNGRYYTVHIPQPVVHDTDMLLYFGTPLDTNVNKTSIVNWEMNTDPSAGSVSYAKGDTMSITTNRLNLVNGDKPFTGKYVKPLPAASEFQTFRIKLTSTEGINNTVSVFALYKGSNVVWPVLKVKDGFADENHVLNIPVHFIAFAVINGNFYAGIIDATPMTGIIYGLNVVKTTPDVIAAQIDALD